MEDYITISSLNDFIFCPYSIYLHNVYMGGKEDLYHATPQTQGKAAHATIDEKKYSSKKDEITSLLVFCDELGIAGKIDIYKGKEKLLIERKYKLETIYRGQIYQLWAEYFCMTEMGYEVEKLAFYAISTNKMFPVEIPTEEDKKELADFILKFNQFNPEDAILINENKCNHCIYCNLCDKTEVENVYT
ncbi:MAG: type V CRISPR-associated protein Cas4 [Bacteroidales bacterium]|jgi:CRISPR-associated protein Cas4|nr:type V CRISPR-associated protein Cas4 [Bacteroidales bacterium]